MKSRLSLPEHYRFEDIIGQGSLSRTLRARDLLDGQSVAVKVFAPPAWMSAAEAADLRSRAIAKLTPLLDVRHPNLCAVRDLGECGDALWVARELAGGESLRSHLARRGTLSLFEAARVASQAADALDALAAAGVRHGSLSANNLVIQPDGSAVVTDAVWARCLWGPRLAGVACCMGPAFCYDTDLAALAALVFTALAGYSPYRADGRLSRAYHLPRDAREALHRALTSRRGGYESASAFASALLPDRRPSLFRLVWRPAAAAGLFAGLATIAPSALSEDHPVSPAVAQAAMAAEQQAALRPTVASLAEEDRQALRLAIRRQGAATLAHPAVAEVFALSEEQQAQIAQCLEEQRAQVDAVVSAAVEGRPATGLDMDALREATSARILLLLTDEQRVLWQSLSEASPQDGEPIL